MTDKDTGQFPHGPLIFLPIWVLFAEPTSFWTGVFGFIAIATITDIIYSIIQTLKELA